MSQRFPKAILDSNIPRVGLPSWNGFFAPAGTPKPIIDRLSTQLVAIGKEPDLVLQLEKHGITAEGTSAEEFGARIKLDLAIFEEAIRAAKLQTVQ